MFLIVSLTSRYELGEKNARYNNIMVIHTHICIYHTCVVNNKVATIGVTYYQKTIANDVAFLF
jgi:hypothetical protein